MKDVPEIISPIIIFHIFYSENFINYLYFTHIKLIKRGSMSEPVKVM